MIELGLRRISRLLAETPLPWRAIHVAGTNGKGSVCAYISEMLNTYNKSRWRHTNGQSVIHHGRFTSPHIVDRWDCISMTNEHQMETVKRELFLETEKMVMKRNRDLNINASEFELLTATAFKIFADSKVDVAVIETGMGGRLDATNIIGQPVARAEMQESEVSPTARPLPLVTAITKIGLDHQGFLGDTVEAIAREKAGIFKGGVPALWDESNDSNVVQALRAEAIRRGSELQDWASTVSVYDTFNETFTWHSMRQYLADVCTVSSAHRHVRENSDVAFRAVWLSLSRLGRLDSVTPAAGQFSALKTLVDDLATTPQRANFPGRLERLDVSDLVDEEFEPVLLDGAHNPQSAEVLAAAVNGLRAASCTTTIWIIAASSTKDVREILGPLLKRGDVIFAVEFGPVDGMPWVEPMGSSEILAAARESVHHSRSKDFGKDIVGALKASANLGKELSTDRLTANVVVAGSLYLVGDVHRLLRDRKQERATSNSAGQ